jgi:hypothetical protein
VWNERTSSEPLGRTQWISGIIPQTPPATSTVGERRRRGAIRARRRAVAIVPTAKWAIASDIPGIGAE